MRADTSLEVSGIEPVAGALVDVSLGDVRTTFLEPLWRHPREERRRPQSAIPTELIRAHQSGCGSTWSTGSVGALGSK